MQTHTSKFSTNRSFWGICLYVVKFYGSLYEMRKLNSTNNSYYMYQVLFCTRGSIIPGGSARFHKVA